MSEQNPGKTRREFLKTMGGAALGGVFLSGCSDDPPGSGPPGGGGRLNAASPGALPNGFRFSSVYRPGGETLGGVSGLTPGILLNDLGEILFYAPNRAEGYGLYELSLDLGSEKPAIRSSREMLSTGNVLDDGRRVDNIVRADVNAQGDVALVLATETNGEPEKVREGIAGVYLERAKQQMLSIAAYGQEVTGGDGRTLGGHFGDLSLNDQGQLLMVAHYTEGQLPQPGLFHVPTPRDTLQSGPSTFGLVIDAGDAVPTTRGVVQSFGLVDFDEDGGYVSQLFGDEPQRALQSLGAGDTSATQESFAVVGNVSQPPDSFTLSAAPSRFEAPVKKQGEVFMGVRVAGRGLTALITHPDDENMILWHGDTPVERTGQASPDGEPVVAISAPVLGRDQLMYYLLHTEKSMQLCVSNGSERRVILRSGDTVSGQRIRRIVHGYHSDQVDKDGRIVLFAEFESGEQAIVLGVPV